MARISGVNIPTNKKVNIALTYIFGIGRKFASDICKNASIDISKRVSELNEDEVNKIRDLIDKDYSVEGDLRRKISLDIKRLNDLGVTEVLDIEKNYLLEVKERIQMLEPEKVKQSQ